jgi:putative phosphoesterase
LSRIARVSHKKPMKALILSDIHANLPALEAILHLETDFDQCLFLGDVVDYGPFPKECIAFLMKEMDCGVIGNHDNALAFDVDCGCRGDFKKFSEETRAWHKTLISKDELKFLHSLPRINRIVIDGKTILLCHATPQGDLFLYLQESEIEKFVHGFTDELILLGHMHIQFKKQVGNTMVVNPGSVGLSRDGGQACYAIFDNGELILKRIPYNVQRTIDALMESPISQKSKDGLSKVLSGEWKA